MFVISLILAVVAAVSANDKSVSVLLVNGLYTGHLLPLLNLGEELVRRGHTVTLVANVLNGSHTYPDLPEQVGIKFISAGYDPFWTKDSLREFHRQLYYGGMTDQWNKMTKAVFTSSIQIRKKVEEIGADQFDIVVCDMGISMVGSYFHYIGRKSVIFNPLMAPVLDKSDLEWPTPLSLTGQSHDLSLVERFLNVIVFKPLFNLLFSYMVSAMAVEDPAYREVFDAGGMFHPGSRLPVIMAYTFGYEYPIARLPLVEYVGPIISSYPPETTADLQQWLSDKPSRSVIFASMGTTISIPSAHARAIVKGVLDSSPYSVVMVIEKTHEVMDELRKFMYSGRLYVTDWVAQQSLLKHHSLLMTFMHCGHNGVHESILSNLPIACMPLLFEQFDAAARVTSAGIGISLYGKMDYVFGQPNITAEKVAEAVSTIVEHDDDYARNLYRLNKMIHLAGGVQRAADLVEHYEDVGYGHLVPAYVKYRWSWYQYYNCDVWAVLMVVMILISYGLYLCIWKLCCR